MRLISAVQQLNYDLAYVAQITDTYDRQVKSLKHTATIQPSDENSKYYLANELFDIDTSLIKKTNDYLDISVNFLKKLYIDQNYNNNPGPYSLITVDVVSIADTPEQMFTDTDGYALELVDGAKILVVNQPNSYRNGIYEYKENVGKFIKYKYNSFYCTIKVLNGENYENTIWRSTVEPNNISYFIVNDYAKNDTYNTLTNSIESLVLALKPKVETHIAKLEVLKQQKTSDAIIQNCGICIQSKVELDTAINSVAVKSLDYDYFFDKHDYYDSFTGENTAFYGKPHNPVNGISMKILIDKLYNNNFYKFGDIGSRIKELNTIANNGVSVIEYWKQIGWAATERSGNYKQYVQLMEEDLQKRGLEEIVDMHGKSAQDTYSRARSLSEGFLHPLSPKPVDKENRPKVDSTLPYTNYESMSGNDEINS